jgi:hypothetical protein
VGAWRIPALELVHGYGCGRANALDERDQEPHRQQLHDGHHGNSGRIHQTNFSARLNSTTTVPVAVAVYANGGTGTVLIKNSAGSTVFTVNINNQGQGWYRAAGTLPADDAKYDLHYSRSAGTVSVYAVSICQATAVSSSFVG